MYSKKLLDHFENPRNVGEVQNPTARVSLENPVCGDILELSLRVVSGRIEDIGFRAKGCVPTIASGSAITELARGAMVEKAMSLAVEDVATILGGVPPASNHAVALAVDAIRRALKSEHIPANLTDH